MKGGCILSFNVETYKNALNQTYSKNNDNIQWQYVNLNMNHLLLAWTGLQKAPNAFIWRWRTKFIQDKLTLRFPLLLDQINSTRNTEINTNMRKFSFFVQSSLRCRKDKQSTVYSSHVRLTTESNFLNKIKIEHKLDRSQKPALLRIQTVYSLISYDQWLIFCMLSPTILQTHINTWPAEGCPRGFSGPLQRSRFPASGLQHMAVTHANTDNYLSARLEKEFQAPRNIHMPR